jgi:large subunit ribosomal protein L24
MQKIKKDDNVIILVGKDKGKQGKVTSLVNGDKVLVAGVNRAKKHQKPNPNKGISGGIIELEMPIHISNVALYNPATKKADRVGFKFLEDGQKVRVFKSTQENVDG